ncbi:fibronectin type III domain-containing protein 10 [Spea bombifrons]|uniref:fibronectin type III domain-containing protein 10 n=1 Tax=Spea bombifrons TaxID=233779 RepID=UPI00234ABF96|nr:fibronectin type III domain-containing protein 10 [Spea bombifrons]
MISLYLRTVRSLLLLCLFEWILLDGCLSLQRVSRDHTWRSSSLMSPGVRAAAGSMEVEAAVTQRSALRFRRGASSANLSSYNSQDGVLSSGSLCPYKVISEEQSSHRRVCFRTLDRDFFCDQRNCKEFRSGRSLLANVLRNNSVLLQWQPPDPDALKGFYMNCSWNGTFTRFQCDSIQLGISCRDYLLTNVHDNVKYRICLQTLYTNRTSIEECVEFTVEPVGMQDIVIAMTAVGGSICVMLVIICLLVAYITENLMHPTFSHPSCKRGP